jgi:hypothetical protein
MRKLNNLATTLSFLHVRTAFAGKGNDGINDGEGV